MALWARWAFGPIFLVSVFGTKAAELSNPAQHILDKDCYGALVVDVDGNGTEDVILPCFQNLLVSLGVSGGGLGPPLLAIDKRIPTALAAADFNRDGRIDIALSYLGGEYPTPRRLGIFTWEFGGFIQLSETATELEFSNNTGAVADFNLDGNPDIAITDNAETRIYFYPGNGTGGFGAPMTSTGPEFPCCLQAENLDADAVADLVLTAGAFGGVYTLRGRPDRLGTFQPPQKLGSCQYARSPIVEDIDGDSRGDLLITCLWDGIYLHRALASGGFSLPIPVSPEPIQSMTKGDLNGDGVNELIAADSAYRKFRIYSVESGRLVTVAAPIETSYPGGSLVADVNGDGLGDLVGFLRMPDFSVLMTTYLTRPSATETKLLLKSPGASGPFAPTATLFANQPLEFEVDVTRAGEPFDLLKGDVSLTVDGKATASARLNSDGKTVILLPPLAAGQYDVAARFVGTAGNSASSSSVLSLEILTVPTSLMARAEQTEASYGAPVKVTALLDPPIPYALLTVLVDGDPTGSISLDENGAGSAEMSGLSLGPHTIRLVYGGDEYFSPSEAPLIRINVRIPILVTLAASGDSSLAPGSLASAFGAGFIAEPNAARLFGDVRAARSEASQDVRIEVFDSAQTIHPAAILYASATQVNFLVPAGVALGAGKVTLIRSDGERANTFVNVERVVPGLFTASSDGRGPAAAIVTATNADGTQESMFTFECRAGPAPPCQNTPITLGGDAQTVLVLFGTGIRNRTSLEAVRATVGGRSVPVLFAGEQPEYLGLDQVNLALSGDLQGLGEVSVELLVDGVAANPVMIRIQ